jgi:hypothetical protein
VSDSNYDLFFIEAAYPQTLFHAETVHGTAGQPEATGMRLWSESAPPFPERESSQHRARTPARSKELAHLAV